MTGSGKRSGIGYAIGLRLASQKYHIVISDLGFSREEQFQVPFGTIGEMQDVAIELERDHGLRSLVLSLDVTDTGSVHEAA